MSYLADEWAQQRSPPCPAVGFTGRDGKGGVWRKHVPGQGEGGCRPARGRGRLGRAFDGVAPEEAPPGPPLPDTPAGRAWGAVLEAVRAAGKPYAAEQLARLRPSLDGDMLVLEAQDRHARTWYAEEYGPLVEAALASAGGAVREVREVRRESQHEAALPSHVPLRLVLLRHHPRRAVGRREAPPRLPAG